MSDWQVGDLAVCVDASAATYLSAGCVYTVCDFNEDWLDEIDLGLNFVEIPNEPGHDGYCAIRFRKIRPDEHEACEPEFVTLLKRSKRTVTASDWLLRAGPIAKQLNEEAQHDERA